ncbi:Uncharacterised protein [Neisseria zoodegmatis]|uniref:Uncharacterized protein n=1 Tax=Neisseria zoodegmatis TaxID=326523 RepID=A0A378WVS0_9NEIS|nr:hypothetical protein [Neisseria zoodegmatis]SUA44551.1 Uncharacterised protein [Neisseria zoodegmatis]
MEQQKYQMYVFRYVDDDDPSFPHRKFWFSAKQWLSADKPYLKISDHDIINKNGIAMPVADSFIQNLYWTILYKEIITEDNLPYNRFVSEVKPTIRGRYLYSEFDRDTLRPSVHHFLVSFRLNGKFYDTELVWEEDKKLIRTFSIYKPGEFLKIYDTYNYQDYLKGKLPESK